MKFTLNSTEFPECMNTVYPAVAGAQNKSSGSCVKVAISKAHQFQEGNLGLLVAFDGNKQILHSFCAKQVEMDLDSHSFYVDGKKLYELSNAASPQKCPMEFNIEKDCCIRCGDSEVHFPLSEEITVINPDKDKLIMQLDVMAADFSKMMHIAGKFYDPNASNLLDSVCLRYDAKAGKVMMASADGYNLSIADCKAKLIQANKGEEYIHIIKGKQFSIIEKVLEGSVSLLVYETMLCVKTGATIFIFLTRDTMGKGYPLDDLMGTVKKIVPQSTIWVPVSSVLHALNVFDIMNEVKEPRLQVKQGKGQVCLMTSGGTGKTNINVKQDGEFGEITINAKHMRRTLSCFCKEENIVILIGKEDAPIMIKPKEDSNEFIVSTIFRKQTDAPKEHIEKE